MGPQRVRGVVDRLEFALRVESLEVAPLPQVKGTSQPTRDGRVRKRSTGMMLYGRIALMFQPWVGLPWLSTSVTLILLSVPQKSTPRPPKLAPSAWQLYFTDFLQRAQANTTKKLNVAQAAKEAEQEYANLGAAEKEVRSPSNLRFSGL